MTSDAAAPAASGALPTRAWLLAWFGLLVLIVATILAAVDRQILVLLAEPIRRSLNLTDTKLGLLQGAGIALFAGVAALPLGWLADRYGRRPVLAGCVLVWTAGTAACGLAWDFGSLFAAAVALGIGEAGLAPIVYGLIPDIVPAHRRALANGIYAVAAIFGAGLGIALSGTLIEALPRLLPGSLRSTEPWRLSFFAVALPGPLVALLIALIRVHRPPAGQAPAQQAARPSLRHYLGTHGGTVLGVFGGSGLAGLGIAALAAWAPVVASRHFGASPQEVGQGIGAGYLAGTVAGALVGGWGVKWLSPRVGVATPLRVIVIGLLLSALASAGLAFASSAPQVYLLFGLQVAFLIAGSVLGPTVLQDMSPAALRSRVIALGSVITVLLSALSPVLVGLLSDALRSHADALQLAVALVATASMVVGAFLTWRAEARFVRTVAQVAEHTAPASSSALPGEQDD